MDRFINDYSVELRVDYPAAKGAFNPRPSQRPGNSRRDAILGSGRPFEFFVGRSLVAGGLLDGGPFHFPRPQRVKEILRSRPENGDEERDHGGFDVGGEVDRWGIQGRKHEVDGNKIHLRQHFPVECKHSRPETDARAYFAPASGSLGDAPRAMTVDHPNLPGLGLMVDGIVSDFHEPAGAIYKRQEGWADNDYWVRKAIYQVALGSAVHFGWKVVANLTADPKVAAAEVYHPLVVTTAQLRVFHPGVTLEALQQRDPDEISNRVNHVDVTFHIPHQLQAAIESSTLEEAIRGQRNRAKAFRLIQSDHLEDLTESAIRGALSGVPSRCTFVAYDAVPSFVQDRLRRTEAALYDVLRGQTRETAA